MPDFRHSTLTSADAGSNRPSTAAAPAPSSAIAADARCDLPSTRKTLREVATELRSLDGRLAFAAQALVDIPDTGDGFSMLCELRGAIDGVREDLLADAIETLEVAGTLSEGELRRRFAERRRLLIL